MKKAILERYEFLIKELTRHDELYEQNMPEIGDGEYDDLFFELLTIEKDNPEIINKNSPSQKVNTVLVSSLEKKKHSTPKLSQNKVKSIVDLFKFLKDLKGDIIGGEKLDGLTIILEYNNGKFICATTRGDGYEGEVVTHNVKTFKNVPKRISFKGHLEIRAEALVLIKEFERIIAEGSDYSNPRNLASGTIRQLDSKICAERNMEAKVFELEKVEGKEFSSDVEALEWLRSLGFDICNYKLFKRGSNFLKEIEDYVNDYENKTRKTLNYMIDGLVFKSNDYKERKDLGYTSKWPRWSVAFKFKSQEATTQLLDVVPQVGKTGQITPVAILKKVNIEVDIERATLNNYKMINKMGLKIGDTVVLIRSNDVIPKITTVIKTKRTGKETDIVTPDNCPVCNSKTEFIGEHLYCTGTNCPAQIKGSLLNFVSRGAMNITGLGKKTINDFYEKGFLNTIQDIYKLSEHKEEICKMDGYGEKKYINIINSIEKSKSKELNNLIQALSIKLIGASSSKDIAKHFKDIDKIIELAKDKEKFVEECLKINDFGPEKTNSLYVYFSDKENNKLIKFLKDQGLKTKETIVEKSSENKFIKGKIFVITGDVNHFKNRNELKDFIENNGGKCSGSVSKKTSYLINNDVDSASSKNNKAKELEVPIISENEFLELLKGE